MHPTEENGYIFFISKAQLHKCALHCYIAEGIGVHPPPPVPDPLDFRWIILEKRGTGVLRKPLLPFFFSTVDQISISYDKMLLK